MELMNTLLKVRDRIAQHGAALQQNEMLTRYALIDPVLRALGWDTEDPTIVVPEYTTPTGRMDYVLFWDNQRYIALEAKAWQGNLPGARNTGFQYCWHNQIPFYLISDGDTWELYDMTVQGGHILFNLQITKAVPLGPTAYALMRLHRAFMPLPAKNISAVVSSATAIGQSTLPSGSIGSPSTISASPPYVSSSPSPGTISPSTPTSGVASMASQGVSLADLHRQGYPVTGKQPKQVIFPNNISAPVRTWKDLLIEIVRYLVRVGKLPTAPFSVGLKGQSYLYNTTPTRASGNPMRQPDQVSTSQGTIYVETHGSANWICRAVYTLVSAAGVNPQDITIVF